MKEHGRVQSRGERQKKDTHIPPPCLPREAHGLGGKLVT